MDDATRVREGMEVRDADGQLLGTVERVGVGGFVADGRRMGLDAVERIEGGRVHLWANTVAPTDDSETEAVAPKEASRGLPNTDSRLFLNERPVEDSLEERMPDNRPR